MNRKDIMSQARFWTHVDVITHSNSSQCWEWKGGKLPNGYGMANGVLAHRFVASQFGDIEGKVVRHICDNPSCVRPDHLEIGTQKENLDDMSNKGRRSSKVNPKIVKDIRTKFLTREEYARKYGISECTVGDIQRYATWKWV